MSVTAGTFPGVRIVDMPDLGAFTDDSSIVGEHAGSGRFGAVALRNYMGRGIVNVLDQGARGDGVTDDTAAIQAVLTTYAGKSLVLIPSTGLPYMVTGLSLPAGTDLTLNGRLLLKPGTVVGGIGLVDIRNVSNVTIRGNGVIDGNNVTLTTGTESAGLSADSASNIRVSGITLQNAHYWNLNVTRSSNVVLNGVTMLGGGNANEFADTCDNCWITNCTMDGPSTDFGFSFYGGITNSGAIGCTFKNAALGVFVFADAGQIAPSKNILLANNIAYNNFSSGIAVDLSVSGFHQHIIISGNRTYNNNTGTPGASAEIWVDHSNDVLVNGNFVSADTTNSAWGVGVGSGAREVSVVDNFVFDIGSVSQPGTGLYVNGALLVQASGNTFRGPAHMTASIGGTAGAGSSFMGNFGGAPPVTITPTGDTVITSTGASEFAVLAGTFTIVSQMQIQNAALAARWFAGNVGNAESGSDSGSDFAIYSVRDGGTLSGFVPLTIKRSTGAVTLAVAPTITTLPTNALNDAAAAAAGVQIGQEYRNGSVKMIRAV